MNVEGCEGFVENTEGEGSTPLFKESGRRYSHILDYE